jgi:hypothetical protein
MSGYQPSDGFNSNNRRSLFLELACRPEGAAPLEVWKLARDRGDDVTEEAYYNIARRLAHRGLLRQDGSGAGIRYFALPGEKTRWLDEDDLFGLIDPDYPLPALMVANESAREMRNVPEQVWTDLRHRLEKLNARELFERAITSYCRDFADQIQMLVEIEDHSAPAERAKLRREADTSHLLLIRLVRYGLGISADAIPLPMDVGTAIKLRKRGEVIADVNVALLKEELCRRVANEHFVVSADVEPLKRPLLIGAVDGSTRGGVLSFLGEEGDFILSGHAPLVSINTAVGQIDRDQKIGNRYVPTFLRLPERPEDMQRDDNRFAVMAKMLFPDMSDGKYMHAVWNAMDLLEAKAALRLLAKWTAPQTQLEIPPADVVLKDGAVSPQDRDFSHYAEFDTYGRIVRDAIGTNWDIAKQCKEDGQTVAGVVKTAQLSVFAPVVNWFACQLACEQKAAFGSWPMRAMNLLPDQVLMTHLLTAGRRKLDPWVRTCIVVRPFHALTSFARTYQRSATPSTVIMERHLAATRASERDPEKEYFWDGLFQPDRDPYVKMLDHVSYAGCFIGYVARLDIDKQLPRIEFIVNSSNVETHAMDWGQVDFHRDQLIRALKQNAFDVSAEHNMFDSKAKLDVLPALLIRVHDTVKHWAADLLSRVHEYIGYHIAKHVRTKRMREVNVRPFNRTELELLYESVKRERDAQAGGPPADSKSERTRLDGPEAPSR